MKKGYIQVYTGDGKGKTTAAMGLAMRAAGAGLKIFIGQFVKGMKYSELDALHRFDDCITVKQFGRDCFIHNEPEDIDIQIAQDGLKEIAELVKSNQYDMIILDEANIALYYNLFTVQELLDILKSKADSLEIIITGRRAPKKIIEFADLVTEMVEVKHYYEKGVQARIGIEK